MSRHESGNMFAVTLFAAAAGFVAGLLLAPKSGADMREDLRRGAKELESKARHGASVAQEVASEGVKSFKGVYDEATGDAKELASDAKTRAKRTVKNLENAAHDVESKARSAWGKN